MQTDWWIKIDKAIFLDRDGVINKLIYKVPEKHNPHNYVLSWSDFEFIPEAIEGLKLLAETDYHIFVVSNQSGIGRGWVDKDLIQAFCKIDGVFKKMRREVKQFGGRITDHRFCPHDTDEGCACRKPQPGLIYTLAVLYGIDLSQSWMIGDSDSDILAGHNAGISKLIKIDKHVVRSVCYTKDYEVDIASIAVSAKPNLLEAVEYILKISSTEAVIASTED